MRAGGGFSGSISSGKTVNVSRKAKEEVSSVRKSAIWILGWLRAAALPLTVTVENFGGATRMHSRIS